LGLTGDEIAEKLGISHGAAYKYLPKVGKNYKKWTEKEIQILTDGIAEGLPPAEIAAKLKRTLNQVVVKLCRYRQSIRADPQKREILYLLTLGFKAGATPKQVIQGIRKSKILRRKVEDVL